MSTMTIGTLPWPKAGQAIASLVFLGLIALGGCTAPAVRQQRLVSRPNMLFSDSLAWNYDAPRLLPQIAPGFAGAGASQNSGCTSCR